MHLDTAPWGAACKAARFLSAPNHRMAEKTWEQLSREHGVARPDANALTALISPITMRGGRAERALRDVSVRENRPKIEVWSI
jgi:hypothetical protein